eukprot:7136914-Alexandrium_andersonii.AAC.1
MEWPAPPTQPCLALPPTLLSSVGAPRLRPQMHMCKKLDASHACCSARPPPTLTMESAWPVSRTP